MNQASRSLNCPIEWRHCNPTGATDAVNSLSNRCQTVRQTCQLFARADPYKESNNNTNRKGSEKRSTAMKTSIKLMSVAIAVCGVISTAHAQTGPITDPYWSQFLPKDNTLMVNTPNGAEADVYWSQFLPHENAIVAVTSTESRPMVDAYWSQFLPEGTIVQQVERIDVMGTVKPLD
jgi:hypothetical protein